MAAWLRWWTALLVSRLHCPCEAWHLRNVSLLSSVIPAESDADTVTSTLYTIQFVLSSILWLGGYCSPFVPAASSRVNLLTKVTQVEEEYEPLASDSNPQTHSRTLLPRTDNDHIHQQAPVSRSHADLLRLLRLSCHSRGSFTQARATGHKALLLPPSW